MNDCINKIDNNNPRGHKHVTLVNELIAKGVKVSAHIVIALISAEEK